MTAGPRLPGMDAWAARQADREPQEQENKAISDRGPVAGLTYADRLAAGDIDALGSATLSELIGRRQEDV